MKNYSNCAKCGDLKHHSQFTHKDKKVDYCRKCRPETNRCPVCFKGRMTDLQEQCRECSRKQRIEYQRAYQAKKRKTMKPGQRERRVKFHESCKRWPMCLLFMDCHDEDFINHKADGSCYYPPPEQKQILLRGIDPMRHL